MFASKLIHNTNNFNSVSGVAQTGILVNNNQRKSYYFGLEEWNNHPILKKMKVGYLDCYRVCERIRLAERIVMFTYNPQNRNIYHCGNVYDVEQLDNNKIQSLRHRLVDENWFVNIQNSFNNIDDLRGIQNHTQYSRCWNSQNVIADKGRSFILNIKYKKIEFFEPPYRNLTQLNRRINNNWRRLIQRYTVPNNWVQYF